MAGSRLRIRRRRRCRCRCWCDARSEVGVEVGAGVGAKAPAGGRRHRGTCGRFCGWPAGCLRCGCRGLLGAASAASGRGRSRPARCSGVAVCRRPQARSRRPCRSALVSRRRSSPRSRVRALEPAVELVLVDGRISPPSSPSGSCSCSAAAGVSWRRQREYDGATTAGRAVRFSSRRQVRMSATGSACRGMLGVPAPWPRAAATSGRSKIWILSAPPRAPAPRARRRRHV